jgi:hypothetical protein
MEQDNLVSSFLEQKARERAAYKRVIFITVGLILIFFILIFVLRFINYQKVGGSQQDLGVGIIISDQQMLDKGQVLQSCLDSQVYSQDCMLILSLPEISTICERLNFRKDNCYYQASILIQTWQNLCDRIVNETLSNDCFAKRQASIPADMGDGL